MNILYLNEDNRGGGSTQALLNYVQGMRAKGHNVFVLTRDDDGFSIDEFREKGASVYLCDFELSYYPSTRNPFKWLKRFLWSLYKWYHLRQLIRTLIKKNNINIVHTNVGPLPFAVSVCKQLHIPHVWHHREFFDFLTPRKFFPYRNYYFKNINALGNYNICITQGLFDYLYQKENKRSKVIYDGVFSRDEIPLTKKSEKDKYFLFVGTIVPNKAPDELIRSFIRFHAFHPEYNLMMAGRYNPQNKYYKICADIVEKSGLSKQITFCGYRKDVRNLMRNATAVVVTSLTEGFGFVAVESMLNNTLVIGRNTTGTKEQFDLGLKQTGGEIGLRFSNEDEMVKTLLYAAENETIAIRNRAFEVVCNNYTIERCVDETESFYKSVITDFYKGRNIPMNV